MKKTRYIKCFVILLLTNLSFIPNRLKAQSPENISELKIGNLVPDLVLENIVNYHEGLAHLSDFTSKLLIIDFWETWCPPCVKGLPHFQKLQSDFNGQLQVLLVSTQPRAAIAAFLDKTNISLPSVTQGKYLSKLFPHKGVPYQVWIKDGKVCALTTHEAVTEKNIRDVLSGKLSSLAEKKFDFDYDPLKPLLLDGNGGKTGDLQYRSLITGYIDGIGAGGVNTDSLGRFKIRATNAAFQQLYLSVFRLGQSHPLGRINRCIVSPEAAKLLPPKDIPDYSPEVRDKYFCYELIVPASMKGKANDLMLKDLNRFFGALYHIHAEVEKLEITCWALRKMPGAEQKLATNSSDAESKLDDFGIRTCKKYPFPKLVKSLSYLFRNDPYPLVDQTGITGDIDISYPTKEKDISRFNNYLKSFGLYLQQEPCEIEMLVIKDIEE